MGGVVVVMSDRITVISDVIGDAIRAARKREGLTREEFAAAAWEAGAPQKFTAAVVGYIETGRRDKEGRRRREVTVDELVFLAKAAGVTPLQMLGDHAALLGGDTAPECPQCAVETGELLRATREDIRALGDLVGIEASLAQTCYALAAAIDAGGGDDGGKLPQLAKELRATLKELVDQREPKESPDAEEDPFDGLDDPD